jgi:hypothetical protein
MSFSRWIRLVKEATKDTVTLREERHCDAAEIVASGRPFVLLLRTYKLKMPWKRNFQNELFDALSPMGDVLSIRGEHLLADQEEGHSDPAQRARCPALSVSAEKWAATAYELISRATCIICEVWTDTPGISIEVTACRSVGRADDTVLLLPPPGLYNFGSYDIFEGFWRLVLYEDLCKANLGDHPSVRGLIPLDRVGTKPEDSELVEALITRNGLSFDIVPEFIDLAAKYLSSNGDLMSASVYAQSALHVASKVVANNGSLTLRERDAVMRAAIITGYRLSELKEFSKAIERLDLAAMMAKEEELKENLPFIQQVRHEIRRRRSCT